MQTPITIYMIILNMTQGEGFFSSLEFRGGIYGNH